ncbi:putative UDP-glucuronosyl/UDP-glucosyltransferase, UDP-glycosyltransferase family [Helianthus annuus]|nr:putative UDP-glucuronosyl/UDP-glucosyltransferase, UDP-glycosyltransferase family [Helianthus annuus]
MALASGHEYMTKMISHPLESLATKLSSSLYFQTTCCFSDSYFRYLVKSLACFQQTKMESSTVVMYPSPGIGHLVSMVELGKLIHTHHPSLSVIILILTAPYETGATGKYINTVSATTPTITFHHLPVITLPPDFSSEFIDLAFGLPELYNSVVHNTLVSISQKSTIKAVILDFFSNAAFQVSTNLSLPTYYFFTSGTFGLCAFLYLTTLHKTTSKSIKDLNTLLDIPGVPPIHSSHMPTAIFDRESNSYKNFMKTSNNMAKCSGIIVNSFLELEERAVATLRDGKCITDGPTPPIYFIGPLIASGSQVDPNENECLKWLKTQPSKSVVFLCFGSMGVFEKEQLKEIAVGLERSGQRFLWVVRNPPSESSSGANEFELDDILPEGFLTRTKDKGLVVKNWAPQPAILGHESVGGFVSHCGWNSSLEAVVSGVPMVAWPLYAEQQMNRVYLVEEIKVALWLRMSADGFVGAEAVEETVRKLMEGEEGRAVREQILEMSGRAKAAVEDGGSSRLDFLKLTRPWTDQLDAIFGEMPSKNIPMD